MGKLARLVGASSNVRRRDILLRRARVEIGRDAANDIVVRHPSVSRSHARIARAGDRYTIADLRSTNGVRVTGNAYGKVELRAGDYIDLGHVRFRFVAPGEKLDRSRDLKRIVVPTASRYRRRKP